MRSWIHLRLADSGDSHPLSDSLALDMRYRSKPLQFLLPLSYRPNFVSLLEQGGQFEIAQALFGGGEAP